MSFQIVNFTPEVSFIGGLIIGLATTILLVFNAKIAGISGIFANVLSLKPTENTWRYAFIVGLILSPVLYGLFFALPPIQNIASLPTLAIAGVLVGIGTQFASGCTSGHGICGLSRLSIRSLIATLSFMGAGFITVYFVRHWGA